MGLLNDLMGLPGPRRFEKLTPLDRASLEQNDADNAARILSAYGDDMLYVHGKGWAVWDGTRYSFRAGKLAIMDIGQKLRDLVLEEARAVMDRPVDDLTLARFKEAQKRKRSPGPVVYNEDDEGNAKARRDYNMVYSIVLKKHATKCGNAAKIKSALELCEHQVRADIEDLDNDPLALVVPNGQVDLRRAIAWDRPTDATAKEIRQQKQSWLVDADRTSLPTKCTGVPFDPGAQCPNWLAFLELIIPDIEVRDCLHRAMGMMLMGRNDAQVALLFRGAGGNGKSTFVKAIHHVMGERDGYAAPCKIEMFLVTQNQNAGQATPEEVDLPGARVYIASEPAATDELSAKKIKALTGGDPRPCRALAMPQFIYHPTGTPILSFNRTPKIKDEDEGTRRRLIFFPFDVNLRALPKSRQRDPSEVDAELRAEGSGILNWMLDGLRAFKERGIDPPGTMLDLKATLLERTDPVGMFVAECCAPSATAKINVSQFYRVYQEWCKSTGSSEYRQKTVGDQMTEKGFEKFKTVGVHYWRGLDWVTGAEMDVLLAASGYERTSRSAPEDEVPF